MYKILCEKVDFLKTNVDGKNVFAYNTILRVKKRLLIIGKSENPSFFRGVNTLFVYYFANEKACMISLIFTELKKKTFLSYFVTL